MSTHLQTLLKLSELVKINKVVSAISRITSSSPYRIKKLKTKHGSNLSFSKMLPKSTKKVINNVVAPAFLSDANYTYLYPTLKDRELAVYDRFNNLIPSVNGSQSVNSYVLFHENKKEHIGHVLLYSPSETNEDIPSNNNKYCHEDNGRKFSRQLMKVSNKLSASIKMLYLSYAMKNEYTLINNIITNGYWEISCVSISPFIQSTGYGTIIMNNIHKIIKYGNENNYNYNTPTILFTSTPSALRFYQRLGYQLFMEHNINNDIISYSLIYHHDEVVLKLWMQYLKKYIPYYHNVDRFSLMPSFVKNLLNKTENETTTEDIGEVGYTYAHHSYNGNVRLNMNDYCNRKTYMSFIN